MGRVISYRVSLQHLAASFAYDNTMKVLMFGWEFPPHISGGLGTACLGLTTALADEDVQVHFVVPRAYGDESFPVIGAGDFLVPSEDEEVSTHEVETVGHATINTIGIRSTLTPYTGLAEVEEVVQHWSWTFQAKYAETGVTPSAPRRFVFTGKYGPGLMEEVVRYAEVAATVARKFDYDVIHAHDWLTFRAGIAAKQVSGKPLVVHVHATEFDRAGEKNIDSRVFDLEKEGMVHADRVIAVSQWTKDILVSRYGIDPAKVSVVHNGIMKSPQMSRSTVQRIGDHVVTFLGRITYQKGPEYFVEAAGKVLRYFPETHFVVAGSGDMLPAMIDLAARNKLSRRIHFTGFLKGKQLQDIWSVTDVYVMPSISEPFGITPLEAAQAGVPVIVSRQSGVAEVMDHAIKVDFWDTDALADAIVNILRHKGFARTLRNNSKKEIRSLTWKSAATKIIHLYHELL